MNTPTRSYFHQFIHYNNHLPSPYHFIITISFTREFITIGIQSHRFFMGVVRLNKQQLLLLEKSLEKLEHMSEILDRMQQNPKRVQESLVQWHDQEDEEEVVESVEEGIEDKAKEKNIPMEAIIHTTIPGKEVEKYFVEREHLENPVAVEEFVAVSTNVYPKEISLL